MTALSSLLLLRNCLWLLWCNRSLFVLIHSPVMSVVQFCLFSFVFVCCICSSVNPLGCLSCLYHASCILLIRKNINTWMCIVKELRLTFWRGRCQVWYQFHTLTKIKQNQAWICLRPALSVVQYSEQLINIQIAVSIS
jgi:hypothetical protein